MKKKNYKNICSDNFEFHNAFKNVKWLLINKINGYENFGVLF
jgi:hypothetical protein